MTIKDLLNLVSFYQAEFLKIDKMIKEGKSQLAITRMLVAEHGLTMWDSVALLTGYVED